ncbi:MAG: phosphate signaling complex protein PhoU [Acidobacteriota bacterium]|nr:phosphate signaling complex protein PhoU [Acidobacteriota bacterium]
MGSAASVPINVYATALESYLVSMAKTVEASVSRSFEALLTHSEEAASDVFTKEPRINEMEIIIDEHAVRLLRGGNLPDNEVRHIVSTLKINNDLERMADLAVNICQRAISLSQIPAVEPPQELEPMAGSVRAMVARGLGALIHRNLTLANEVLESEPAIDGQRDQIVDALLSSAKQEPSLVAANIQYILAVRHLERVADHTTNIAEDVVFWLRGIDIRHGRNSSETRDAGYPAS